jgi:hypothetical protein
MSGKRKLPLGIDGTQALQLAGLLAAMFIAVVVNAIAARHYKRWDVTESHRYTLSQATTDTLRGLSDTVEVWVLLGGGDPLEQSVKQLLVSYQAETSRLDVHAIDPDRDTLALVDLQRRFHIEAGRTEEGRVTTDAVVIVARGEKRSFLTHEDMYEVASGDDPRAKPREEQAITGALRKVTRDEAPVKVCFTSGHGELSVEPTGDGENIGNLKFLLERDMYTLTVVDTTLPNAFEPFKGCDLVVVARPQAPFTKEEEARLRTYLLDGGSALLAVSPVTANSPTGMSPPGIADALAPFGIALDEDLVVDTEPAIAEPGSHGATFIATAKPHPVTQPLVQVNPGYEPPKVLPRITRSLSHVSPDGAAPAADLLVTTKDAYAVTSLAGAEHWVDAPPKQPTDRTGPFVLAMASERPKVGKSAPHGPRVVVIGSGLALHSENWLEPRALRGMAFLVENAISWLTARPAVLDVPERPAVSAGIRITEESLKQIRSYVLLYMPAAVALLGIAIALRRRSTEGAPRDRKPGDAARSKAASGSERLPSKRKKR